MSRVGLLFSRRVSLYVSLPVIAACGATGYIASAMQPGPTGGKQATFQSHSYSLATPAPAPVPVPVTASAVEVPPSPSVELALPAENTLPRHGSSVASFPTDEIDLPTPLAAAPAGIEQIAPKPAPVVVTQASTSVPVTAPPAQRTRAARAERRTSSTPVRRSLPTAQPRVPPASKSAGLKGIPLIGPVFSLLQ
jgi:hypothetical protein